MLYEIISPDPFLRPYIDKYKTLTQIYYIVRNSFAKRVYVDKEFQRKTADLVKDNVSVNIYGEADDIYEINDNTIKLIKESKKPDSVKIINLIKSIEKTAEEKSGDLVLISIKDKAQSIQENYEDRIVTTEEALEQLEALIKEAAEKEKKQKEKGLDDLEYYLSGQLKTFSINNPDETAKKFKAAFKKSPDWDKSEAIARDLRLKLYSLLLDEKENIDDVNNFISGLFNTLLKSDG